jgi:hypothetical protein
MARSESDHCDTPHVVEGRMEFGLPGIKSAARVLAEATESDSQERGVGAALRTLLPIP